MKLRLALALLSGGIRYLAHSRATDTDYDWQDRVTLIVGGSRGLGLLLARRLARKGAHVVLAARDGHELQRAKDSLAGEGLDTTILTADVAKEDQAAYLVEETLSRLGRLDVLINAASIISVAPLDALSLEDLRAAVDVNFWGTVATCWAALPHLKHTPGARIVNVSSIGGVVAVPHLLPYVCGKFAVTGFSQGLQAEAEPHGIRVVTVIPWLMRTGSAGHALVKGKRGAEAALFHLAASLPLLAVDAGRAADRILLATERGERFVTVGWMAKALRIATALAPNLAGGALAFTARLLPGAPEGAAGERPSKAGEHPSAWTRSFLTVLGRRAARHNNQLAGQP